MGLPGFSGAACVLGARKLQVVPLAGDLGEHELQPLGQRGHRTNPLEVKG
jgi:hypothetical protein